jgi:hypothetical protein
MGCGKDFTPPLPSADFSLSISPSTQSIQAGSHQQLSVMATALNGFTATVSITFSGLPSEVTAPTNVVLTPGVSATVTLSAAANAPVGSATITVHGVAGSLTHTTDILLNVTAPADFSLTPSVSAISIQAGGATQQVALSLTGIQGFTSPVMVMATGIPAGVTVNPAVLSLSPGTTGEIAFSAARSTEGGVSTITLTGTSGSLTHTVALMLSVTAPAADFTLSTSPAEITLQAAGSTQFSVMASPLSGFNTGVSVSISGLPPGVTANPSTFSLGAGAPQTISLTAAANAALGASSLTLTGTAAQLTHSLVIPLTILVQPTLTINVYPATFNLAPGLSQTLTISATDSNALSKTIDVTLEGLPVGISASPSSLSLASGSTQQLVFTAGSDFTLSGSATLAASVDEVTQQQMLVLNALPVATSMVTDGLMAYFPINEGQGTTIGDVSGNGYLGTFGGSGNLWTSAGVSLNGNGWIDLPADLNSAQTIQMWIDVPTLGPSAAQTLVGTTANGTGNALSWVLNNQAFALWLSGGSGSVAATPLMGSATSAFVEGSSSLNTTDQFWINGDQAYIREPSISAVAGLVLGGHLQLGAGEGINNLSGTVGPIAFYNRPLTSVEIAQNSAFFNQLQQSRGAETQEGNSSSQNQFIAMGDSITFGFDAGRPYCEELIEPAFNAQCLGYIGQITALGVQQAPQFANYYDTQAKQNIFFDWYVSNDVANGIPASQTIQNQQTTCSEIKQVYPGWKVVVGTMMSRFFAGVDLDPEKNAMNDLIRQGATTTNDACDGYIDVAADPNLGADGAYAGPYFADMTHPTDLGELEIAGIVTRYINSMAGATPVAPTVQSAATYIMTTADNYINATVGGDAEWVLPECIGLTGKVYTITNQGTGNVSLVGTGSESITGNATIAPNATASFQINLISDATGGCSWARN